MDIMIHRATESISQFFECKNKAEEKNESREVLEGLHLFPSQLGKDHIWTFTV